MPVDQAVRILTGGRGSQFDAAVVDAFERGLAEILEIRAQTVTDADLVAA